MAISAVVAVSSVSAHQTAKKERKKAEAEAATLKAEQAEEARKLAESTPTGSMGATSRIANERLIAARRAGKGRSGTMLNSSARLG